MEFTVEERRGEKRRDLKRSQSLSMHNAAKTPWIHDSSSANGALPHVCVLQK
jgi:hypothetical protein